jgi:hypothetical protein
MILAGKVRDGSRVEISANKKGLTFNGEAAESDDDAFEEAVPKRMLN